MAITTLQLDPITRVEGHLKVRVDVDTVNGVQQVVNAYVTGNLFRGFEKFMLGRDPRDAQHITERICGVCPVSHGMAAVMALDAAAKVTAPDNARIMRNLVMGANFLDSHILHFYHLTLMDYIDGPAMAPWQPGLSGDRRLDAATSQTLLNHYIKALEMRRKAHEMGAIFGGRMPHPPTYIPGGFTTVPKADQITKFKAYLNELLPFIRDVYINDVETLATGYADYLGIGVGNKNLLAFGCFDLNATGSSKLFPRGRVTAGGTAVSPVDLSQIIEQVRYSWYADSTGAQNPATGDTVGQYPKANAYTWLKAPRYAGAPYEVGPLARMWVSGAYTKGISVMDRHRARAYEAWQIAMAMNDWVSALQVGGPVYTPATTPSAATVTGLTEAPRGALGHWVQISGGKLARYQIVTPTCWNASPRDEGGTPGPLEQALIGAPVKNMAEPIEVLRIIHSFDPCLDCAVHVMRPNEAGRARLFHVGHVHGGEEVHTHSHEHDGHDHDHAHAHDHGHGPHQH